MGWPEMAAGFKNEFDIPFRLLVDTERLSYKALEIRRGSLMDVMGPSVWLPWTKAVLRGNFQGRPQLDVTQLGGALVVAPGGEVRYRHTAKNSADNAPVDDLLAALP